jgi:uncharacterized protein with HEPN domain
MMADLRNIDIVSSLSRCSDTIEKAITRFGDSIEVFISDIDYHTACSVYVMQLGDLVIQLTDDFKVIFSDVEWDRFVEMKSTICLNFDPSQLGALWDVLKIQVPELHAFCLEIEAKYQSLSRKALARR